MDFAPCYYVRAAVLKSMYFSFLEKKLTISKIFFKANNLSKTYKVEKI